MAKASPFLEQSRGTTPAAGSLRVTCQSVSIWLKTLPQNCRGLPSTLTMGFLNPYRVSSPKHVCLGRGGGRRFASSHSSNLSPVFVCRASLRASAPDCRSGGRVRPLPPSLAMVGSFPKVSPGHEKAPRSAGPGVSLYIHVLWKSWVERLPGVETSPYRRDDFAVGGAPHFHARELVIEPLGVFVHELV